MCQVHDQALLSQAKAENRALRQRCEASEAEAEERLAVLRREVRRKAQEAEKVHEELANSKLKVQNAESTLPQQTSKQLGHVFTLQQG